MKKLLWLGLLGGQRRRLYQDNLDRLFNPKNGLSLAFFKKLTIAKNFIKPKLLNKTVLIILVQPSALTPQKPYSQVRKRSKKVPKKYP